MKFAKLAPKALLLVLTTAFLVAISFAQDIGPVVTAPPLRLTVWPGISTLIYVKTLPNAACALYTNGLNDVQHTLQLYADQEGTIHFNAQPPLFEFDSLRGLLPDVVDVLLQCKGDSATVTTYPIELRASFSRSIDFPAPSPLPKPEGMIRPALRGAQLSLSNQELLEAGYPMRPDPKQAPGAYASWLRAVSEPVTLVSPETVPLPGFIDSPTTQQSTSNWSGFELDPSNVTTTTASGPQPDPYDWVTGTWIVPSVTGEPIWLTNSVLWIGLDGAGTTDLIQDGTQQNSTAGGVSMPMPWWFSTYWVWTTILPNPNPNQPTEEPTNLVVTAGDMMFSQVWIANPVISGSQTHSGPPTPTGNSAFFYVQDLTTRAVFISPPEPLNFSSPVSFTGQTAEWIMERPAYVGSPSDIILPDLANYDVAFMYGAEAQTASGIYVDWNSSANTQLTMEGCTTRFAFVNACMLAPTDVLSTAAPSVNVSGGIQFNWHNFH